MCIHPERICVCTNLTQIETQGERCVHCRLFNFSNPFAHKHTCVRACVVCVYIYMYTHSLSLSLSLSLLSLCLSLSRVCNQHVLHTLTLRMNCVCASQWVRGHGCHIYTHDYTYVHIQQYTYAYAHTHALMHGAGEEGVGERFFPSCCKEGPAGGISHPV